MKRRTISTLLLGVVVLGTAPACSSQSSADYQGDPLLKLKATVAVPKEFEGEELVPVLYFPLQPQPAVGVHLMEILDVEIEGSFPSNFTLEVYDPPPESALSYSEGLPKFAVGYISAMSPSHPSLVKSISTSTDAGDPLGYRYCTVDESRCFETSLSCPPDGGLDKCAPVSTTGDPALQFAGYSLNAIITYAPEPIPADSAIAFTWASGEAIPAGYHLRRMVKVEYSSGPEAQACRDQAWEKAHADYNEIHGTNHSIDVRPGLMERPWRFSELLSIRLREGGCLPDSPVREVPDPANAALSITLGAQGPLTSQLSSD